MVGSPSCARVFAADNTMAAPAVDLRKSRRFMCSLLLGIPALSLYFSPALGNTNDTVFNTEPVDETGD
jgi:hypothetical protein